MTRKEVEELAWVVARQRAKDDLGFPLAHASILAEVIRKIREYGREHETEER